MANFTWKIANLEYNTDGKGVVVAHWRCTGTDSIEGKDYSASAYGTVSFTPDSEDPEYIPFDDLTEEIVLGWVYFSQENFRKDIEKSIDLKILNESQPATMSGMPWASQGE